MNYVTVHNAEVFLVTVFGNQQFLFKVVYTWSFCVQDGGFQPPPTLASGYGIMDGADVNKPPAQILDEHEKRILDWLNKANPYALKAAVDSVFSNQYWGDYKKNLWDPVEGRKFGEQPHLIADVVKFDMWLKKYEISEKKPSPPTKSPPAKSTALPSPPKASPPKASPPMASPAVPATPGSSEIEPPQNPEAYKKFWEQYKRSNAAEALRTPSRESMSTTAPSPNPAGVLSTPSSLSPENTSGSPTGVTPDCKRKLSLGL